MTPVAGVDGCRAGWIVVHDGCATVHPDFATVLAALPDTWRAWADVKPSVPPVMTVIEPVEVA